VLCGTFEVFEDRVSKSGRKIVLKIVVFPATGKDKAADPLFYIPGGPGSSATEDAPYVAQQLAKVPRIAFLAGGSRSGDSLLIETFWRRMKELGYIEGQNISAEYRFAEGEACQRRALKFDPKNTGLSAARDQIETMCRAPVAESKSSGTSR